MTAFYEPMRDLREFHTRFLADKMEMIPLLDKRRKLIKEEFNEVMEALEDYKKWVFYGANAMDILGNEKNYKEHLAKELADLLYVVYGTADELDIPLEEVFAEVHKSNMGKPWPDGKVHYTEYGKVIKPPTYSPPDLSFIHEHRVS